MTRVKRGNVARKRRKKILKLAKGFRGGQSKLFRTANQRVLAPKMVDELLAIVRRIRDEGVTVLLVEQNVAKALAMAQSAYVLERGAVVMKGAARSLLGSEELRASYLGTDARLEH